MPLAVGDLGQAKADFEKLGFVLKPGRRHDDGIRNLHVKFANHGGIELITAAAPADEDARDYVDWLKGGDGPAWWALYAPDLDTLTARLSALGLAPEHAGVVTFQQEKAPHRLFFADLPASPTDSRAWLAHPNTAYRLARIWIAGGKAERGLLVQLGATPKARAVCAPFARRAQVFVLADGDEVVFTPHAASRPLQREVVGATVLVKDLGAARRILDQNHVPYRRPEGCDEAGLWVSAHGAWLQFLPGAG